MKLLRRHVVISNLLCLFIESVLATLIWFSGEWFFGGSVETFGPLHSYGFIWLSIVIASIAALNSIFSTTISSDTHRPFLSKEGIVDVIPGTNSVTLRFTVTNTGSLPADVANTQIRFFAENEEIKEDNESTIYHIEVDPKI